MVFESVQNYVNLVSGLSEATRAGARKGAQEFWSQAGPDGAGDDTGTRVGQLAEEIRNAGRANRELLENLISTEVTRAVRRLGFVRSDDLDEVREEIAELRHQLERRGPGGAATAAATTKAAKRATTTSASTGPSTTTSPGKVAAAKRAAARTAAAAVEETDDTSVPTEPPATQRQARKRPATKPARARTSAGRDGVPGAPTDAAAVPGNADAGA